MRMLLLLGLLAAGDPAAAPEVPPDAFADRVYGGLGATRDECLRGVARRFGSGVDLHCGFPEIKSKHFLDRWSAAFPDDLESESVKPLTPWIWTLGGWFRRYYAVDGVPTLVAYGGKHPGLLVGYFRRYPDCAEGDRELPRAGHGGVSKAQRVREAWVAPDYPLAARVRRLNGMALFRTVIDDEGNTRDVCLLDVFPPGFGFEEEARAAIERERHHPALDNGTAVEVQQTALRTFEIN